MVVDYHVFYQLLGSELTRSDVCLSFNWWLWRPNFTWLNFRQLLSHVLIGMSSSVFRVFSSSSISQTPVLWRRSSILSKSLSLCVFTSSNVCALIWFDRACEGGNTEGFFCRYENAHVLSDALSRDVRRFSISLENVAEIKHSDVSVITCIQKMFITRSETMRSSVV